MFNSLLNKVLGVASIIGAALAVFFRWRAKQLKKERNQQKQRADSANARIEHKDQLNSDLSELEAQQNDEQKQRDKTADEKLGDSFNSYW